MSNRKPKKIDRPANLSAAQHVSAFRKCAACCCTGFVSLAILSMLLIVAAGCNSTPSAQRALLASSTLQPQHPHYHNPRPLPTSNQPLPNHSAASQHYLTPNQQPNNQIILANQTNRLTKKPVKSTAKNTVKNKYAWYDPTGLIASLSPQNSRKKITQTSYADVNPAVIERINGGVAQNNLTAAQKNGSVAQNNLSVAQRNSAITQVNGIENTNTQPAYQRTSPPQTGIDNLIKAAPLTKHYPNNNAGFQYQTQIQKQPNNYRLGQELIREITPVNDRRWSPNHAVLQTADFNANQVTIRNVRYSTYNTNQDYTTRYYDATFNLDQIRTIDLIIVPLRGLPSIAHVQSSFGFADGKHILMSITARYEEGEIFDPIASALRQFELIYVFADERDVLRLDSQINKNDVYLYRLNFAPHEVRTMFVDALQRANKLAAKPEFYHPVRNSCVTNLVDHINKGRPKAIPANHRTLFSGMLGKYVFDLKLVDTQETDFKVVNENAKINWLVERFGDLEYFSAGIRNKTY
ncbi:MAG: DUF4105 domain-containing protein [Planctomycetaceae bacterium]|nr:DUF4105 domain-containing protein [Planctomycetaceae bacterium]